MTNNSDYIFINAMPLIIENKLTDAKKQIIADLIKLDPKNLSLNQIYSILINNSENRINLIQNTAGIGYMSDNISKYYYNPRQALIDYELN